MSILTILVTTTTNCIQTTLFGEVCDNCEGGAIFKIVLMAVNLLTAGIGVLATIGIIVVGIQYLTARDNAEQVARAKKRFLEIIIGIVCYGLIYLILGLLIPGNILNITADTSTSTCQNPINTTAEPISTSSSQNTQSNVSGNITQPTSGNDVSNIKDYKAAIKNPAGTTTLNALGQNWTVANTTTKVRDYMKSLSRRRVAQDNKDCNDSGSCIESDRDNDTCLSFAETFAYDMVYGTTTSDHCASAYRRASNFYSVKTFSKEDTLSMIYDQLSNGWPVVVQVKYSTGRGRHFVVAVGYKASVKSRSQFTENDLLFLNTDGSLRAAGNRTIMTSGGSTKTKKSTLDLWSKSNYGYYVRPFRNPGSDKKARNIKSC